MPDYYRRRTACSTRTCNLMVIRGWKYRGNMGDCMRRALDWRSKYSRRIAVVDAAVIIWAVVGAYIIRFGLDAEQAPTEDESTYVWISVSLVVGWWIMLGAWNSRESRILGAGSDEYKRVAAASLWLFGLVATISYVSRIDT